MALNEGQIAYIKNNYRTKSDPEMAKHLGCHINTVSNYRKKFNLEKQKRTHNTSINFLGHDKFEAMSVDERLVFCKRKVQYSPDYVDLQKMFGEDELERYVRKYAEYYSQMRTQNEEVTATEESQISQLCKYDVLMDRILMDRKYAENDELEIKQELKVEQSKEPNEQDMIKIRNLLENLRLVAAANSGRSKEFVQLQEKHSGILKDLKATRDQRIKQIKENTSNFYDLVKYLTDRKNRDREMRQMELQRLAMEQTRDQLGALHTFSDGEVDRILISEETV